MSGDVLIKVDGVSKKFCRSLKKSLWYGLKDIASEAVGRNSGHDRLRPEEFWAVNDISFELRRGECLGLIGRNGAGKTTLLKMLNGLIKPDKGRIEMRGRVGALIALGAGFNPILTGRENIYVNGSVLGLTKREIASRIEAIVDFADIREFIDAPVQNYSSGMAVRLGFAVTTALEPDILLIDEILAVGDMRFRSKCYDRLQKKKSQTAIIFVSHNRADISRICERGILFDHGRMRAQGNMAQVLSEYDRIGKQDGDAFLSEQNGFNLRELSIQPVVMTWGSSLQLNAIIESQNVVDGVYCRLSILDSGDNCIAEWKSTNYGPFTRLYSGINTFSYEIGPIRLGSGSYSVNFILGCHNYADYLILNHKCAVFTIEHGPIGVASYQI
jgi:lipopolysaccharide transport system ATP-binding protein